MTFHERIDAVRGKLLAMNVRRLPAWVLSRAHHVAREGVWPDYRPEPMPSAAQMAESTLPDQRLEHFAFRGPLRVERWLRLEHLREDFLALASDLTVVTPVQARRVRELPALDVGHYDRELHHWFSEAQLDEMYERNPRWAALELELYGSLLGACARGGRRLEPGSGLRAGSARHKPRLSVHSGQTWRRISMDPIVRCLSSGC